METPRITLDKSLTHSQNMVNAINDYWKLPVARLGDHRKNEDDIVSQLKYGVPNAAFNNNHYPHDAVIYVRWMGRRLIITRR